MEETRIRDDLDTLAAHCRVKREVNLRKGNKISVESVISKTSNIQLHRSVAQGSPISPTLFNLAIDDIIKDLTDIELEEFYGFEL
ncbi:hypothetical protein ANN_17310 [Periplaneta americana]|uniref:Reverse transcriptase domain-containing protein n=1 Tax=Periplaneta americana TaxID=6978 RepID=A0ABQ8SUP5_PERAM|nr:hypothetical protein ANN_17310 [Periplaneta americana]